ncbi:hypothetical protein N7540_006725 [Penicillium herquei]|nr:hypothetical protein N7540_006725 [Penicillium herquei]
MLHHGAGYTRLHLTDGVLAGRETRLLSSKVVFVLSSFCVQVFFEISTAVMAISLPFYKVS